MKKRIYFIICLLLFTTLLISQTKNYTTKGSIISGGLISAEYYKQEWNNGLHQMKDFTLDFSPYFGYFILNKLNVGLDFTYRFNQVKYIDIDEVLPDIENSYFINPFLRFYIYEGAFLYSKIGFGKTYSKDYDVLAENGYFLYENNYLNYNIGVGYSIFLNKNIAIDIIAKYYSFESKSEVYFNSDDKNNGFNLSIGFQIFIPKKEK